MGRAPALMLLLAGALQTPARDAPAAAPGPRQSIAGIRSLECRSTIVYAALPDAPHRLESAYAFPDRARWWLGVGVEPSLRRQMRFRNGQTVFAVDADAPQSRKLEGQERSSTILQLEMRRALFLWPHGFDWKRKDARAEAELADIGTLSAVFTDARAKNPTSFAFTARDGNAGDEYRAIAWREEGKKAWPTRLELWHDKALVWTETVDSVGTATQFIDSYFLPPDTRSGAGAKALEVGAVRPIDLPETRSQRIALAPGTTWDDARKEHARVAGEKGTALKTRGLQLDDRATFEVSETLAPTAIVLRLGPLRDALDPAMAKEWPLTPERPGLSTFVMGIAALEAPRLESLRKAAPPDAVCGTPYVRFDPAHPDQHVMVLLPLEPKVVAPAKEH